MEIPFNSISQALAELNRTGQKQRFNRLQVLLSRSQMYSTYILGRLNSRREAEKKRLEREQKKREELKQAANNQTEPKEEIKVGFFDVFNTFTKFF